MKLLLQTTQIALFVANKVCRQIKFVLKLFPHTSTKYVRCGRISAQYNAYIDFVFSMYLTVFKIAMQMNVF